MSTWFARTQLSKEKSPLSDAASPSRILALRSGPMKRPSFAMQIGTISMRSAGAAPAIERAERIDTSCSGERPPKMRRVRVTRLMVILRFARDKDRTSLRNRHAPQQILQIVVPPPDPAAEDERGVVERVVDAAADEEHRRARLGFAQRVLAEEAQVRVLVIALREVEGLAGEADARVE